MQKNPNEIFQAGMEVERIVELFGSSCEEVTRLQIMATDMNRGKTQYESIVAMICGADPLTREELQRRVGSYRGDLEDAYKRYCALVTQFSELDYFKNSANRLGIEIKYLDALALLGRTAAILEAHQAAKPAKLAIESRKA